MAKKISIQDKVARNLIIKEEKAKRRAVFMDRYFSEEAIALEGGQVVNRYMVMEGITQKDLAKALSIDAGAVCRWLHGRIPAERVMDVVEFLDGQLTPQQIRPDVFR